jgi:hypothetical protein
MGKNGRGLHLKINLPARQATRKKIEHFGDKILAK